MTSATADTRQAPRLVTVAAAAVILALILNTLGVFTEDVIHWSNWLIVFVIVAVAAAIVFGWLVRRALRNPTTSWRTGLILALLGLLTVAAFWSGLPPIFGIGAIYLGYVGYRGGTSRTSRRAGIGVLILGALVVVLDVVLYASDISSRV